MNLNTLYLYPPSNESILPADLLTNHRITNEIRLFCPNRGAMDYQMEIHPEAFRASRNFTKKLLIQFCDVSRLEFSFLEGFENLFDLSIDFSFNIHLARWISLPKLPSLSWMGFVQSTGLDDWSEFPVLVNGLTFIDLQTNWIGDDAMDRITQWALRYSYQSLETLWIFNNALNKIPENISNFEKLASLWLGNQRDRGMHAILNGSLAFTAPLMELQLQDCGIETIEPGAFKGYQELIIIINKLQMINIQIFVGDFSRAKVSLSGNRLTRVDSSVFEEILRQMSSSTGRVDVRSSKPTNKNNQYRKKIIFKISDPFDCESDTCHLAWLIRDNRPLLLPLWNAMCSNGTDFWLLDPNGYDHCDSIFI